MKKIKGDKGHQRMQGVRYKNGVITCICPDCDAMANFDYRDSSGEFGSYCVVNTEHSAYRRICYVLFRCTGCGRGGIAKIYCNERVSDGVVQDFYPTGISKVKVPKGVPESILAELREAERCASARAWRAGSAMIRSVLEKIFKEDGYTEGRLKDKINEANKDGIITDSRAKKAHDDVRALGNDVLHGKWKEVTEEDFSTAYHYCQRVIEDFYDERDIVLRILEKKGKRKVGEKK